MLRFQQGVRKLVKRFMVKLCPISAGPKQNVKLPAFMDTCLVQTPLIKRWHRIGFQSKNWKKNRNAICQTILQFWRSTEATRNFVAFEKGAKQEVFEQSVRQDETFALAPPYLSPRPSLVKSQVKMSPNWLPFTCHSPRECHLPLTCHPPPQMSPPLLTSCHPPLFVILPLSCHPSMVVNSLWLVNPMDATPFSPPRCTTMVAAKYLDQTQDFLFT